MTKALVCIMNWREGQPHKSYIQKLFGDPEQYVHKLGNDTFDDQLPIHMDWLRFSSHKYIHYLSIDYNEQMVYFSNNFHGRLEMGPFIYTNRTYSYILSFIPVTQVTI